MMSIVFINGSPNKTGNTEHLAKRLLQGKEYDTVNLTDYKIYAYGQHFDDDQYDAVIQAMADHDVVVIGSPMYWHSMCGAVRNVLDRAYGYVRQGQFSGKKLFFIFQGAAPTQEQLAAADYTMGRFAAMYGFTYAGMITNQAEAATQSANV